MEERNLTNKKRIRYVMVHLTEEEHSLLEQTQAKLSCSKSQVLRMAFLNYTKNGSDLNGNTGTASQ